MKHETVSEGKVTGQAYRRRDRVLRCLSYGLFCFFVPLNVCHGQITNEVLRAHEARKAHSYKGWRQKPVSERISAAPEILVDYLRKDNELNGYPEIPLSKECDDLFLADLRGALAGLPESVRSQIRNHLVGIYTVSHLGTTGYTEVLDDFETNRMGFIVLDVDYLKRTANDWATWKENSPFRRRGSTRVKVTIEPMESDNRKQAIQFILTHEIGHLAGALHHLHPDWSTGGNPEDFAYSRISWVKEGDRVVSRFDRQFPMRKEIRYYRFEESTLSSDSILDCYRHLAETDFSSLYAATNMWDDFAENYAIYVHTVLENKPWRIEVLEGNSLVEGFGTVLLGEKGRVKKRFMDGLMGR